MEKNKKTVPSKLSSNGTNEKSLLGKSKTKEVKSTHRADVLIPIITQAENKDEKSKLTGNMDCEVPNDLLKQDQDLCETETLLRKTILEQNDIIKELKTTISVLEADNKCLNNELQDLLKENDQLRNFYNAGQVISTSGRSNNRSELSDFLSENSFSALDVVEEFPDEILTSNNPTHPSTNLDESEEDYLEQNESNKKATVNGKKVYIFADSHGKGLYEKLTNLFPKETDIFVSAISNATSEYIFDNARRISQKLLQTDTLVLLAGSNDYDENSHNIKRASETLIARTNEFVNDFQTRHRILIVPVFHRWDLNWDHVINKEVNKVNKRLKNLSSSTVQVINTNDFKRNLFTRHGLHLNSVGKQHLCKKIQDAIRDMFATDYKSEFRSVNMSNCTAPKLPKHVSSKTDERKKGPSGFTYSPNENQDRSLPQRRDGSAKPDCPHYSRGAKELTKRWPPQTLEGWPRYSAVRQQNYSLSRNVRSDHLLNRSRPTYNHHVNTGRDSRRHHFAVPMPQVLGSPGQLTSFDLMNVKNFPPFSTAHMSPNQKSQRLFTSHRFTSNDFTALPTDPTFSNSRPYRHSTSIPIMNMNNFPPLPTLSKPACKPFLEVRH